MKVNPKISANAGQVQLATIQALAWTDKADIPPVVTDSILGGCFLGLLAAIDELPVHNLAEAFVHMVFHGLAAAVLKNPEERVSEILDTFAESYDYWDSALKKIDEHLAYIDKLGDELFHLHKESKALWFIGVHFGAILGAPLIDMHDDKKGMIEAIMILGGTSALAISILREIFSKASFEELVKNKEITSHG